MSETHLPAKTKTRELPGHDIFCTPENNEFVSKVPYQSLSATEREIRLLKILPDSGSGFIECELLPCVKLPDIRKQYRALSYCAGSARNTQPIKVNGAKCNVFANLHHALEEARHYWQTLGDQLDLLLWVDQICINQFDLAERSHQVGFMRDIYKNARETLICISTPETHKGGMKYLLKLRDALKQLYWNNSLDRFNHLFLYEIKIRQEFAKSWAAFFEVGMSPWWGRAWIFQEFMVSEETIFLHGRYSIPYSDFMGLVRTFQGGEIFPCQDSEGFCYYFERSKDEMARTSTMWTLLGAKANQSWARDLKVLLMLTKDSQATDARDKLYSLLGLINPGYGIVPDYSTKTDIHNLLVETTKRIILFDDNLDVLSYRSRVHPSNSNPEGFLPSWVLDWTNSTSLGRILDIEALHDASINVLGCHPHPICQSPPDVSFSHIPHPQNREVQTTTIQVWAILLDNSFQVTADLGHGMYSYEGVHKYKIVEDNGVPVERDYGLWIIRGSQETFLLSKYSYGYRIIRPIRCTNLAQKLESEPRTGWDEQIDMCKMKETRITIF